MPTQIINSEGFVGTQQTQTINSNSTILATITQVINSDVFVGTPQSVNINSDGTVLISNTETIDSDAVTLVTQSQTIVSDTRIRVPLILYGQTSVIKPESDEVLAEVAIGNPVPSAPTSLVAIDAGLGDVVNLNWVSSAQFFNVYRKNLGPVYVKLNPNVLQNVNSYSAGGLTPGSPVIFVVRAVNGLGQESPNSNEATATPTFNKDVQRFYEPTYEIKINGIPKTNAILESVKLGYGSTFSTASFTLPVDPRLPGEADLDDDIEIRINSRLVFNGFITTRGNTINLGDGLRIPFRCHSNILNLTTTTRYSTDVNFLTTVFNLFNVDPDGLAVIKNRASAAVILSSLGVSGGPNEFPGQIDITDMTPLAAAELVLSRVGNYKIYHDMATGQNSVYQFGSNGFNVREFHFGLNIISYDIQKSNLDVVKHVVLIGSPKRVRTKMLVSQLSQKVDPDGRLAMSFDLGGKNIRDIEVFGFTAEQPAIVFDDSIQIGLEDFSSGASIGGVTIDNSFHLDNFSLGESGSNNSGGIGNSPISSPDGGDSQSFFGGGTKNTSSNDKKLYPVVKHIQHFLAQRQGIGAKIQYSGTDSAQVFLSEVPKLWYTITRSGSVKRSVVGLSGTGTFSATVLLGYDFRVGTVEVEYTVDQDPPVAIAGSGLPSKSITDTQYEIIQDSVSGFDNTADITNRMTFRVNSELARLNKLNIGGTIVILGDETVDLRQCVKVEGELLEISGITHSFVNGFTTTVDVINEPFFRDVVIPPSLIRPEPAQKEATRKAIFESFENKELAEVQKELSSQKDKTNKDVPSSGAFAKYQD